MINLQLMNKAVFDVELTDKEFRTLYLICNYAALNNTNTIQIHNGWLMDKLNLCERQVRNVTNGLDAKGYIKKEVTGTRKNKNANTYTIVEEIYDEMNEEKKLEMNCEINDEINLENNCPLKKNIKEIKKEYKNNINNNINNNIKEKETDVTSDDDKTFEDYLFNDDNEQGSNNVAESEKENELITSTSGDEKLSTKNISSTEIVNQDTATYTQDEFDEVFDSSNDVNNIYSSIFKEDCPTLTPQNCAAPPSPINAIEAAGSDETNIVEELPTDTIKSEQDASKVENTAFDFHNWCSRMNDAEFITSNEDDIDKFKTEIAEMDALMMELKQYGTPQQFKTACNDIQCWYGCNTWNMDINFITEAGQIKRKYKVA